MSNVPCICRVIVVLRITVNPAEKDDWRCYEASRPDATRGVKCFDCFEWPCRMSIMRRRLDVDTGTFESGASRFKHCARINLDSRRGNRTQIAVPDVSISAGHTCIPTHRKDSLDGEEAVCIHDFEGIDRETGRQMLKSSILSYISPINV